MELLTESEQIIIILNVYEKLWNMVIMFDVIRNSNKFKIDRHVY